MGYAERVTIVNKISFHLAEAENLVDRLYHDYAESRDSTDDNFPNKIAKLGEQINSTDDLISSINEANLSLSLIEP